MFTFTTGGGGGGGGGGGLATGGGLPPPPPPPQADSEIAVRRRNAIRKNPLLFSTILSTSETGFLARRR